MACTVQPDRNTRLYILTHDIIHDISLKKNKNNNKDIRSDNIHIYIWTGRFENKKNRPSPKFYYLIKRKDHASITYRYIVYVHIGTTPTIYVKKKKMYNLL